MTKQTLSDAPDKFDLKFLLVGRPGTGKTHFLSTYTKGPVHWYMFDPGGEKTVRKVLRAMKGNLGNHTFDFFQDMLKITYTDVWRQLQKDAADGFFDELAEKNGMVNFDSFTKISQLILQDVARRNKRTLTDQSAPMRIQDWGQVTAWTRELVSVIDVLPCAVACTCHFVVETNEDGAVIGEFPSIIGGSRYTIDNDFDEVYRLQSMGNKFRINFRGTSLYAAKTRIFDSSYEDNLTMDSLFDFYMTGKALKK